MPDPQDYFKTKEHEDACMKYIEAERQRVSEVVATEGPLAATSLCVAMLAAHSSFLKAMGLKRVAISILQDSLKHVRKGPNE